MFESFKRGTNAIVKFVNRAGVNSNRAVAALAPQEERLCFLSSVRFCASQGYSLSPFSEASQRLNKTRFLTLPKGMSFRQADKKDVAIYDLNADAFINPVVAPQNLEIHKLVYRNTENKAVLLFHPKWAFLHFARKRDLDFSVFPALEKQIGSYAVCKAEDLPRFLPTCALVFINNIGALSMGETLAQALERIELLEWICWQNQS